MATITVDYQTEGHSSDVMLDGRRMKCTGTARKGTCTATATGGIHVVDFGTAGAPGSEYSATIKGGKTTEKISGRISSSGFAVQSRAIEVASPASRVVELLPSVFGAVAAAAAAGALSVVVDRQKKRRRAAKAEEKPKQKRRKRTLTATAKSASSRKVTPRGRRSK